MPGKKAVVIGGGIVGIATARALALKGFTVCVLEKHGRAIGASVRNFGMIWPIGQDRDFYDIAIRSREIWKEMAQGGEFTLEQQGSIHLAYHADELQVLEEVYSAYKGERDVQICSADQTLSISSAAKEQGLMGSLYSREECIVDPPEAIAGATRFLVEKFDVEFMWNTCAIEVNPGNVITSDGRKLEADLVFVCSGSDLEILYPKLFRSLPITKCKLQMMRTATQEGWNIGPSLCAGLSLIHYKSFSVATSLSTLKERYEQELPVYVENGIHVMVAQNSRGELVIGDSHEYGLTPDPFDKSDLNALILSYLSGFATFKNSEIKHTWNGTYAKLTDGSRYIFQSPEPGVFILNGLGGNGMTLSLGLAEKLVDTL